MNTPTHVKDHSTENSHNFSSHFMPFDGDFFNRNNGDLMNSTMSVKSSTDCAAAAALIERGSYISSPNFVEKTNSITKVRADQQEIDSFFNQFENQHKQQMLLQQKNQLFQQIQQPSQHYQKQQSPQIQLGLQSYKPLHRQPQFLSRSFSESSRLVNYGNNDTTSAMSNSVFNFGNSFGLRCGDQQNLGTNSTVFNNNSTTDINNNKKIVGLNKSTSINNMIVDKQSPYLEITETCSRHSGNSGQFYCKHCDLVLCTICLLDGICASHEYIDLNTLHRHQTESLRSCEIRTRNQLEKLQESEIVIERLQTQLSKRYEEMVKSVDKTHSYFLQIIQERKDEIFAELELSYTSKSSKIQESRSLVSSNIGELNDAEVLIDTLVPIPFNSKLVGLKFEVCQKIEELVSFRPDLKDMSDAVAGLNFYSNRQIVRPTIRNAFGFVGSVAIGDKNDPSESKQGSSISRNIPVEPIILSQKAAFYNEPIAKPTDQHSLQQSSLGAELTRTEKNSNYPYLIGSRSSYAIGNELAASRQSKFFGDHLQSSILSPSAEMTKSDSCSSRSSLYQSSAVLPLSSQNLAVGSSIGGFTSEEMAKSIFPSVNIGMEFHRIKMEYHCKFGEFGSEPGQFTEPSGVAVGRDKEILVADANNHRIQAFDCSGAFRRIIGQDISRLCQEGKGQNEGDLVYPNRLAVNKSTGDIYVTERSPTHQVRVYDESGRFVRRFGAHVLQHPRGITVDKQGRIIVIECKVMRVVIFSSTGSVLNRFVIEKKVNFPNGVAVNDHEEIFISDNRRHGVVVFDYQGAFLRTIGGIGVTNYPIGVGINSTGEVVVADNHNNFNVTLFTQDGKLIRALESRVKHAQCFDTALMGDGSIVLSSKDFRIYIYHYASYPTQSSQEFHDSKFI